MTQVSIAQHMADFTHGLQPSVAHPWSFVERSALEVTARFGAQSRPCSLADKAAIWGLRSMGGHLGPDSVTRKGRDTSRCKSVALRGRPTRRSGQVDVYIQKHATTGRSGILPCINHDARCADASLRASTRGERGHLEEMPIQRRHICKTRSSRVIARAFRLAQAAPCFMCMEAWRSTSRLADMQACRWRRRYRSVLCLPTTLRTARLIAFSSSSNPSQWPRIGCTTHFPEDTCSVSMITQQVACSRSQG